MPKRLPRARTLKGDPKLAYYDSAGGVAGEPVIALLHSSLARSEDWENIFPRLATRYRTIAYDARGHGKSGRASDYTLRAFADDALRVLREVAKAPAVLIGHSLGALTALLAASEAPDLVRAIVLEEPFLAYAKAWDPSRFSALREALGSGDPAALAKAVAKHPLPSPGPRGERTYGELRGFYAAERVVSYFRDIDPAFIDARTSGDDPTASALTETIAKVRSPSLVLAGEPRLGGAVDDASEWKLKKLPEVTVKRFPGSGHLIHGFRPEQFLENIEPFLRKLREAQSSVPGT
ncbi:MAG TPA: alpha/beta hydrolase [Candidatus Limnocylindria bacterium]|jgi:pimeloyl-ACP methyl ester carboxylesterase|nr:alpha/beta hydrolase [Candidatus Limnocylindria bacterium]HEV8470552.1 alpha/beta hydrolase [Candidatus Limnocylindria bacterium]